jgi:hypothetical protein
MLLCKTGIVRTTIDLPDDLARRTKAAAALRGMSMKDLIVKAIERDLRSQPHGDAGPRKVTLPLVRLKGGRRLDLRGFDFDDLLA